MVAFRWQYWCKLSTPRADQVRFLKYSLYGLLVQLVRTPACHAGGQRFKSAIGRHESTVYYFHTTLDIFMIDLTKTSQKIVSFLSFKLELRGTVVHLRSVLTNSKTRNESHADVAQLAEQLICNQQVAGSIPVISSIYITAYWLCLRLTGSVHYFYWLPCKKHRRVHTHSFGGRSNVGYVYLTFIWACISVGRISPLQGEGQEFESPQVHQLH